MFLLQAEHSASRSNTALGSPPRAYSGMRTRPFADSAGGWHLSASRLSDNMSSLHQLPGERGAVFRVTAASAGK
jgi:hypothetical protein